MNWDDNVNFMTNPHYRGFGWSNLRWMFTSTSTWTFEPLGWLIFAATYAIWGMNPLGYHLVGLVVHVLVALVLYFTTVCLLQLAAPTEGEDCRAVLSCSAGMAALLFALHPLRVEVVAWASGLHHALATLFILTSIFLYLKSFKSRSARGAHRRWLALALVSYFLSLLAGPIGVTLPIVLLIVDAYLSRQQGAGSGTFDLQASLLEKLPFFLLAALGCLATWRGRAVSGFLRPFDLHSGAESISQALFGFIFYIWKTLLPMGLSPLYPLPHKINPLAWPFLLSGFLGALITAAVFLVRRSLPSVLAVWAYYIVTLLPVLGFVQFGPQIAADRYTYLSSLGFAALEAGGLLWLWKEKGRRAWRTAAMIAVVLIATLGCLTWREIRVWRDSEALWRHALSVDAGNAMAQDNLGFTLAGQGEMDEAIKHFDLAIQAAPDFPEAHEHLGLALAGERKIAEAIKQFNLAIMLKPDYADAHYNLGLALAEEGETDEAIREYNRALQAHPDFVEADNSLGVASARQGKSDEAIQHFTLATQHHAPDLQAQPNFAEAQFNLGRALAGQGKIDEAIRHFKLALQARPDYLDAYNGLGISLAMQGKRDEAIAIFRQALSLNPNYAPARGNLEMILHQ